MCVISALRRTLALSIGFSALIQLIPDWLRDKNGCRRLVDGKLGAEKLRFSTLRLHSFIFPTEWPWQLIVTGGWEEWAHVSLNCPPFRRTISHGALIAWGCCICAPCGVFFRNASSLHLKRCNQLYLLSKDGLHSFWGLHCTKSGISLELCHPPQLTLVETECPQKWCDSLTPTSLNRCDDASPSIIASNG